MNERMDQSINMELEWSDTDRGDPKYWDKTGLSVTFFTTNPTRIGLELSSGLRGEKLATKRLDHSTTLVIKMLSCEN